MSPTIKLSTPRRKHGTASLPSPFARAREAQIRWIANPGPHANDDLTRWLEAERGVCISGGRR